MSHEFLKGCVCMSFSDFCIIFEFLLKAYIHIHMHIQTYFTRVQGGDRPFSFELFCEDDRCGYRVLLFAGKYLKDSMTWQRALEKSIKKAQALKREQVCVCVGMCVCVCVYIYIYIYTCVCILE